MIKGVVALPSLKYSAFNYTPIWINFFGIVSRSEYCAFTTKAAVVTISALKRFFLPIQSR